MEIKVNDCFEDFFCKMIKSVEASEIFPVQIANFKGSRGSGKTGFCIRLIVIIGMIKRIKVNAFRYFSKDLEETLLGDFLSVFESLKIPFDYSISRKIINFGNKSQIKFWGLKQSKSDKINLTGLKSENFNFDYGITFKDEITEYSIEESQAIDEAIRGYKKGTILDIRTWNPVNPLHWCNEIFKKYLPENEKLMINFGHQEKVCYTEENEKNEYFSQTNYLANHLLDGNLYDTLKTLPKRDPIRARTMTFGLDGIDEGSLFVNPTFENITTEGILNVYNSRLIDKMDVGKWEIGLDYGYQDEMVLTLTWIVPSFGIVLVDGFSYWKKVDRWIEDKEIIKQMVNKMNEWSRKFPLPYETNINFDTANHSFAQSLKEMIISSDISKRFVLDGANKSDLDLRIKLLKKMIDDKIIFVNISNPILNKFKNEIYYSIGKFNKDGYLTTFETKCDWIDSFCYSWTKISYSYLMRVFQRNLNQEAPSFIF